MYQSALLIGEMIFRVRNSLPLALLGGVVAMISADILLFSRKPTPLQGGCRALGCE